MGAGRCTNRATHSGKHEWARRDAEPIVVGGIAEAYSPPDMGTVSRNVAIAFM